MNEDHLNDSIIENGQNTEKSPGDLRSLAVTQTPVKIYQLSLRRKTLKDGNGNKVNAYKKQAYPDGWK